MRKLRSVLLVANEIRTDGGPVVVPPTREVAMAGVADKSMAEIAGLAPKPTPLRESLKIKGLAETVSSVRQGLVAVRTAGSDLNASAKEFVSVASELQKQIDAARDDMMFEATKLGNSPPDVDGSDK